MVRAWRLVRLNARSAIVYLRLFTATVQVASSVVHLMLEFANDCRDGTFCQKLRNVLFWMDLATLGVDALTSKMLRQTAWAGICL